MAILTVQTVSLAGSVITLGAAAAGGDSFPNSGNVYFRVNNGSGASINVTFDAPNADNFGVINDAHDVVVAVAAGAQKTIGPFPPERFNDANGRVQVTYSSATTVTVAAVASA